MERVSLLWSNIMDPQQRSLMRKLLKYNLHLTERDLSEQHTRDILYIYSVIELDKL